MKKNKTLRIASILLIAVLLTTSMISGTFAKYVTSGEVEDNARVAKFGVVLAAEGSLFDTTYLTAVNTPGNAEDLADGHAPTKDTDDKNGLSVESSNGDKLVAPGTQSAEDGLKLSITGKPEVDVKIKFDFKGLKDVFLKTGTYPDMTKAQYNSDFSVAASYWPIVYTVESDTDFIKDNEATLTANNGGLTISEDKKSMSGNLTSIMKAFNGLNGTDGYFVDANTDLGATIGSLTITWKWAFEGPQKLNGINFDAATVDKADTLLGDLAAVNDATFGTNQPDWASDVIDTLKALTKGTDYQTDVNFDLTVTVTQID